MSVVLKQLANYRKMNLEMILTDVINRNKKRIVDAQKKQLQFGCNGKGEKINPKYASDAYAHEKHKQNSLAGYGTPDLRKTGALYNDLDFTIGVPSDSEYFINSELEYFNDLYDKYKNAFELSEKNTEILRPKIQAEYFAEIHKQLNN